VAGSASPAAGFGAGDGRDSGERYGGGGSTPGLCATGPLRPRHGGGGVRPGRRDVALALPGCHTVAPLSPVHHARLTRGGATADGPPRPPRLGRRPRMGQLSAMPRPWGRRPRQGCQSIAPAGHRVACAIAYGRGEE